MLPHAGAPVATDMTSRSSWRDLPVTLDIARMAVGPEGVDPFLWPIARREIEAVRDTFMTRLAEAGRARLRSGDERGRLFEIMALSWATTVITVFQACALADRFNKLGVTVEHSPYSRLLQPFMSGREPALEDYVTRLIDGPLSSSRLRAFMRDLRNVVRDKGIRHRSFWRSSFRNGIVSIATGSILSAQAQIAGEPVYYLPHSVWFGEISLDELEREESEVKDLSADVMESVENAFGSAKLLPTKLVRDWTINQVSKSLSAVSIHWRRLISKPERLPTRLWTGASGNPYTRLLRRAVKMNKGVVTGHDHGTGSGLFLESSTPLLEFLDCNRFITFTEAQISGLRAAPGISWMLNPHWPEMTTVEYSLQPFVRKKVKRSNHQIGPRRILYMDPSFMVDRLRFTPQRSDMVAMDWVVRLLAKLISWGHDVTYKIYPSGTAPVPECLKRQFGIAFLTPPFEDVFDAYDLILFDDPHSTTFPVSLMSDKDVVLIDCGFWPWAPGARELVEKRCPIVPSWWNLDNRQQIDWNRLKEAIGQAETRRDPAVVQRYFAAV